MLLHYWQKFCCLNYMHSEQQRRGSALLKVYLCKFQSFHIRVSHTVNCYREEGEVCGFTHLNAMYLSVEGVGFRAGVYSFKHHVIVDKIATVVIFSMWKKYVSGFKMVGGYLPQKFMKVYFILNYLKGMWFDIWVPAGTDELIRGLS